MPGFSSSAILALKRISLGTTVADDGRNSARQGEAATIFFKIGTKD
jgi:hypothetical protein